MSPERRTVINGHTVAEYYWGGEFVVYLDEIAFEGSYEEALSQVRGETE